MMTFIVSAEIWQQIQMCDKQNSPTNRHQNAVNNSWTIEFTMKKPLFWVFIKYLVLFFFC